MIFHLCILWNYGCLVGKQLSFDTVVRPCAFQLPRDQPMHRHSCSWSLWVYCLGSNSLFGKTFQKLAPFPLKALAYLQIMCSRPQSEQNISKPFSLYFKQHKSYAWILVSVSSLFKCIRVWIILQADQDTSSLLPSLSVQLWVWLQVSIIVVDPFVKTVGPLSPKNLLSLLLSG